MIKIPRVERLLFGRRAENRTRATCSQSRRTTTIRLSDSYGFSGQSFRLLYIYTTGKLNRQIIPRYDLGYLNITVKMYIWLRVDFRYKYG